MESMVTAKLQLKIYVFFQIFDISHVKHKDLETQKTPICLPVYNVFIKVILLYCCCRYIFSWYSGSSSNTYNP